MANLVTASEGLHLGWTPWAGVFAAIAVAVVFGFLFGLISSRSYGIYFLMITLALSVIVYYFFGQVTQLSGFGGIRGVAHPGFLGDPITNPTPLYYMSSAARSRSTCCCAMSSAPRSASRCRGSATSRCGCARWGTTFRCTGRSPSPSGPSSRRSRGSCRSGSTPRSPRARSGSPDDRRAHHRRDRRHVAARGSVDRRDRLRADRQLSRQWTPTVGIWLGPDRFSTIIGIVFLVIVLLSPEGLIGSPHGCADRLAPRRPGRARAPTRWGSRREENASRGLTAVVTSNNRYPRRRDGEIG